MDKDLMNRFSLDTPKEKVIEYIKNEIKIEDDLIASNMYKKLRKDLQIKKWRHDNEEKRSEHNKKYYSKIKDNEDFQLKQKKKILCEVCNKDILYIHKARHCKSKKHNQYLNIRT
jgi:hypothetical protein